MTEPDISPLAKRLAEENNVNWRVLHGSGAGGKVVERDVLEFLARVMAGEEAQDPTPEPLPEGMEAWPDEDVQGFGAGVAAAPAAPEAPEAAPAAAPSAGAAEAADDDDLLALDDHDSPAAPPAPSDDPFAAPAEAAADAGEADLDGAISEDIFLFDDGGGEADATSGSTDDLLGGDDLTAAPAATPPAAGFSDAAEADLFAEDLGSDDDWGQAVAEDPDLEDDPFAFELDTPDAAASGPAEAAPAAGDLAFGADDDLLADDEDALVAPAAEADPFAAPGDVDPFGPTAAADPFDAPAEGDPFAAPTAQVELGDESAYEPAEAAEDDGLGGDEPLLAPAAEAELEPAGDDDEDLFAADAGLPATDPDDAAAPPAVVPPAPRPAADAGPVDAMIAAGGDVPLVTHGMLLRRHLDLGALAEAQAAVAAELGEDEPVAPTAFLLRAAAKALGDVPLGDGAVAIATLGERGVAVRSAPDASDAPFLGLVGWSREEGGADGADGASVVVADLSELGVDEAVLHLGAPVLTLGRVLYDTGEGSYRSTLSLSGEVSPDQGSRFLARVAELLGSPVRLVL